MVGGACHSSFLQFKKPHLDIAEGDGSGKNTRLLSTLQSAAVNNRIENLSYHTNQQPNSTRCWHCPRLTRQKMNTTSLILTGTLAAALTITLRNPSKPNSQSKSLLSTSSPTETTTTTTPTPPNTPTSSPALRTKHHLRRNSSNSTGWYLDADTPTLQDFEARAQTLVKRLEKFVNRCATDFVMGLMSPAAVVLILFNPVMLVLMGLVIFAMS
jgi:hypothetical protein